PDLQGLTEQQAVEELEALNLVADVEKEYHDTVEQGTVIGQGVDPGEQLRADEQVPVY
ncbi:MAG: PASTA domain-containing protein, partial [Actinobacteria bacterium]|nr:PASTA domain-containing protein [Actinomycetota bacterium]NIX22105.1 PASTA domain-containing protein [Actinomycetota bacterium]